jgi:hypothetical protein
MSEETMKSPHLNGEATRRNVLLSGASLFALSAVSRAAAQTPAPPKVEMGPVAPAAAKAAADKPNILVIFGDDVGIANISAYSNGLMGYETPHIDRIAREGIKFQHYYGEQSCTAGRAAFLTGQHGIRTGLTKVGFPGAPMGMSQLDPSIGGLLKNLGYATGQFGKNHVGDRNPSLPTVNGFDEFFGNLYHLNAEEEPELPDYPKDPAYLAKFGPRGVLRCKATDVDDPTEDPRSARSASRPSRTPARSPRSAWRRSTTRRRPPPSRSCSVSRRPANHSSAGSIPRACICARTSVTRIAAATSMATPSTSTACSSTTILSAAS